MLLCNSAKYCTSHYDLYTDNSGFLCLISIILCPLSVGAQSINGLQVDDTGNVGIGRSNPVEDLHVDATSGHNTIRLGQASYLQESDGRRRLFLGANVYDDENNSWTRQNTSYGAVGVDLITGTRDGSYVRFSVDGPGTYYPTERMRITEKGNVGIGTSQPTSKLEVDGTIAETSARRFKTDVEVLENASALVNQLRGVRYRWKRNGETDVGFVAEEVKNVLPSLVSHTEDGKAKSLNYSHLTAVLVEALKEQTQRTDSLQQRLEEQRQQIDWQKAQANIRTQRVRHLERKVASLDSLLRKHGIEAAKRSGSERHGSENE